MGIFKLELHNEILAAYSSKHDSREKKLSDIAKVDRQLIKIENYLTDALVQLEIEPSEIVYENFYDLLIAALLVELKPSTETLRNIRSKKGSYIKIRPLRSTLSLMLYFYRINKNSEFKIDKKNAKTMEIEKNVNCSKSAAALLAFNLVSIALGRKLIKTRAYEMPEHHVEIKSLLDAFRKFEKTITITKKSILYLYDVKKKMRKGKAIKVYTPSAKNIQKPLVLKVSKNR